MVVCEQRDRFTAYVYAIDTIIVVSTLGYTYACVRVGARDVYVYIYKWVGTLVTGYTVIYI